MGEQSTSDRPADAAKLRPTRMPPVSIRPLRTQDEYRACVELQCETWGANFGELVSPTILKIGQRVGGVAAGAFDGSGRLLGFVFGLTGVEGDRLVHWSHMLAVRETARDTGVGRRLKEYQRDALRALGVETMYWTFDPLVARNAHLNLNRLGAEVLEYVVDMYGEPDSVLHIGLGTDRFVIGWPLERPATASGGAGPKTPVDPASFARAPVVNGPVVGAEGRPVPVEFTLDPNVRVEIPPDIQQTKAASPEVARAWRTTTRRAFSWYLERGYSVTGFYRARRAGRSFYVLSSGEASSAGTPGSEPPAGEASSAGTPGSEPPAGEASSGAQWARRSSEPSVEPPDESS